MKKLGIQLFFFSIPLLVLVGIELAAPPTLFTFRTWEAISFSTRAPHSAPFYKNCNSTIVGVGDLCHHSKKAIPKLEHWITDELGYRNNQFIASADILLIGDSFLAGSSLTQDDTFGNKLQHLMGVKTSIYTLAPCKFTHFISLLEADIIKKPKLIIYSQVERNLPPSISEKDLSTNLEYKKFYEFLDVNVKLDKLFRLSSLKWLQSRVYQNKGEGKASPIDSNMFFYNGLEVGHQTNDIAYSVKTIASYNQFCRSKGIKFVYLPMPNKETVYFDLVPFKSQPDYLTKQCIELQKHDVRCFNILPIYNEYRKHSHKLLYHFDDTHWNKRATELISVATAAYIEETNLLDANISDNKSLTKTSSNNNSVKTK